MGVVWEAQVVVCWYPTEEGKKNYMWSKNRGRILVQKQLIIHNSILSFISLSHPPSHLPGFLILTPSFSHLFFSASQQN